MKCDIKTIFWPAWRITQNMFIEVRSPATRTFILSLRYALQIPQFILHGAATKKNSSSWALEVDEIKMIDDEIVRIAGKIGTDK